MAPRILLAIALLTVPASAANWTEYRTGPFRVISNAPTRGPRERLAEVEQLRHELGAVLGKENLDLVWPIDLVVFTNPREYGLHALPQALVDGIDDQVVQKSLAPLSESASSSLLKKALITVGGGS